MIVVVVWVGALALLSGWSNTDAAMVSAVAVTLLAAALIDSWWVLLAPVPPALLMVAALIPAAAGTYGDGISGFDWMAAVAVVTAILVALLAAGVLLGRAGRRILVHR